MTKRILIVSAEGAPLGAIAREVGSRFPNSKLAGVDKIGVIRFALSKRSVRTDTRIQVWDRRFSQLPFTAAIFYNISHHDGLVGMPALATLCENFVRNNPDCATIYCHCEEGNRLIPPSLDGLNNAEDEDGEKKYSFAYYYADPSPIKTANQLEEHFKRTLLRKSGAAKLVSRTELDKMCSSSPS